MSYELLPPNPFPEDIWEMLRKTEKDIVVYGMGNGADKLIARLSSLGKQVADTFASDGFVRGQSFHGRRVLSFSEVKEKYRDFLVLVSFGSSRPEVLDTVFGLAENYEAYIPDMPLAGEAYFTAAFYAAHYEEIRTVFDHLADEASRELFAKLLWYKLTGNPSYLRQAVFTGDEQALLSFAQVKTAVDVGAYRGDTLRALIACAPSLQTVFAVEPDPKNFKKLIAVAQAQNAHEIVCIQAAAWSEEGKLTFASSGNRNATVGTKIDATASYQHMETVVQTVKIDDITFGRKVDYIKYDTEGAEMEALIGSLDTIEESLPCLRVSAYHRSEDIFALPLFLLQKMGECYDFYFRRQRCIPAWECDLIAVPKQRRSAQKGATYA